MIWISLHGLQYPDGWVARRDEAFQMLVNLSNVDERNELMRRGLALIWRELAPALAELSRNKCWYCETFLARDDLTVDHYRPKGAVSEDGDHPGYWWLALDERNFRLACRYCNERRVDRVGGTEGGKSTRFPIVDGSARAMGPDENCDNEFPVLLDPVVVSDPPLLRFLSDGRPIARYDAEQDVTSCYRAEESIDILHLGHGRLVAPRAQVCSQVQEAVRRADVEYARYCARQREGASAIELAPYRLAYEDAVKRVMQYASASSAYAAAARSIIEQHLTEEREYLRVVLQYVG